MNERLKVKSIEIARAMFDPAEHKERCFVACICWNKNRLIQVGVNKDKTHTVNYRYNPLICRRTGRIIREDKGTCAELSAFLAIKNKTNYNFSDLSIVNVRIDRKMNIKNSRPCSSCDSLLRFGRPKELWFTTDNGTFEEYIY